MVEDYSEYKDNEKYIDLLKKSGANETELSVRVALNKKANRNLQDLIEGSKKTLFDTLMTDTYNSTVSAIAQTERIRENVVREEVPFKEFYSDCAPEVEKKFDEILKNGGKSYLTKTSTFMESLDDTLRDVEEKLSPIYRYLENDAKTKKVNKLKKYVSTLYSDTKRVTEESIPSMQKMDEFVDGIVHIAGEKGLEHALEQKTIDEVTRKVFPTKEMYLENLNKMKKMEKEELDLLMNYRSKIFNELCDPLVANTMNGITGPNSAMERLENELDNIYNRFYNSEAARIYGVKE